MLNLLISYKITYKMKSFYFIILLLFTSIFALNSPDSTDFHKNTSKECTDNLARWTIFGIIGGANFIGLVFIGIYIKRRHDDVLPDGLERIVGIKFFDD